MQTNDYYQREVVTWNHITACRLLVLDRNTWNYRIGGKLFGLDRNIYYYCVQKKS